MEVLRKEVAKCSMVREVYDTSRAESNNSPFLTKSLQAYKLGSPQKSSFESFLVLLSDKEGVS